MNLTECTDVPEQLNKTFNPFLNIASHLSSLVCDKFELIRTSCKHYSFPSASQNPISLNKENTKLNILHINARSIRSNERFEEFQQLITCSGCIWQVICVSETWLYDNMSESRELHGYNAYFNNRTSSIGGGVAIYVNAKYIKKSYLFENTLIKSTQSLLIECQISNFTTCIIGLIYRPPDLDSKVFLDELGSYLDKVNTMNKTAFIIGDFNFDLFNTDCDNSTLDFFNTFASYGFWPSICKATRISDKKSSLIDNIFCNNLDLISNSGLILNDFSDHFPVFVSCSMQLNNLSCSSYRKVFDYNSLDEFTKYLQDQLCDFFTIDEAIHASNSLINAYTRVIEKYSKILNAQEKLQQSSHGSQLACWHQLILAMLYLRQK